MAVDEAQFLALVRAREWNETIDKFRETGDAALKRKLPAFIFQATFDETTSKAGTVGRWRKQAATRLTGLVVMDIDHVDNPREVQDSWFRIHGDMKELGILLIYITPSGKGLKVVFKARMEWGNLIDNQHAMAKLLGVEVDESCKDASRMSFICKESDILFLDKELFTYEDKAYGEKYDEEYRAGKSRGKDPLLTPPHRGRVESTEQAGAEVKSPSEGERGGGLTYHNIPYATIVEAWVGDEKVEAGDRHRTSLILADHLRYITDNDPALIEAILRATPFVDEIVRERNEDVAATVRSAQDYKLYKNIPQRMQQALAKVGVTTPAQPTPLPLREGSGVGLPLAAWGKDIAALFPSYPILADICKGLKPSQYPAAVFVGGGLLMTLMTRCTYHFYHRPREARRLNCSTLIIGDPASGKSFATRLYDILAAPIIEADQAGIEAVNAYRELIRSKGANKDKPKKPQVVIRNHPARTSNAQFIQDMVNSVEEVDGERMQLHMLTFDSELDNTLRLQRGGAWIDKESMELKAFHNEVDGQAYSNTDSTLQTFKVYWNYIYTGTPIALKKKVNAQNFGSGLATRLTCIPLPATNFEMMAREEDSDEDEKSEQRLSEWARKLDRMKGELPMQKIVDGLYDWTARRMMDAQDNDSRADEMLLKRCAYHGLNFAAPFIVMRHWDAIHQEGNYFCGTFETDEVDWQLAELLTNIQYACQRHFFGVYADDYYDGKMQEANVNARPRQKTVVSYDNLPEEFTIDDIVRCFNLRNHSAATTRISRLVKDHMVVKVGQLTENGTTKARYRKTLSSLY